MIMCGIRRTELPRPVPGPMLCKRYKAFAIACKPGSSPTRKMITQTEYILTRKDFLVR